MNRPKQKRSIRRSVAAGLLASTPLLALASPASAQASGGSYAVPAPAVQLIKEVEVAPGQFDEYKESPAGDTVNFRFTMRNTGDTPLTSLHLGDASFPSCDHSTTDLGISASAPLAVGDHVIAHCTVAVDHTIINVATVTGSDGTTEVSDKDAAQVAVYALDIIKDVLNPETGAFESAVSLQVGDTASFRFTVNNTGELDLWDVTVADHLYPHCDREFGDIPAGGNAVYLCEFEVHETIINSATVTGKTFHGAMANDTDYAGVYVRGIDITKQVWDGDSWEELATIAPGDDARYRLTVKNTGSMDLRDVTVDDVNFSQCDADQGVIPDLASGQSWTYECEVNGISDDVTNVARVDAVTVGNVSGSFAGLPVSDHDDARVVLVTPTTATPTTATPTTEEPTTTTEEPTATTVAVKATTKAAPSTAAPTTVAVTAAARTLPKTGSGAVDSGLIGLGSLLMGSALVVTAKLAGRRENESDANNS